MRNFLIVLIVLYTVSIMLSNVAKAETACSSQAKPDVAVCYDKTEPVYYCVKRYDSPKPTWKAGCRSTVAKEFGYLKETKNEGRSYTNTVMRAKSLEMYRRQNGVE